MCEIIETTKCLINKRKKKKSSTDDIGCRVRSMRSHIDHIKQRLKCKEQHGCLLLAIVTRSMIIITLPD